MNGNILIFGIISVLPVKSTYIDSGQVLGELPTVAPERSTMTDPPIGNGNGNRAHPLPFVDSFQTGT